MSKNKRKKLLAAEHNKAYEESKTAGDTMPISSEAKIKAQRFLAMAGALGAIVNE